MYKRYNIDSTKKNLYVVGDIHGNFNLIKNKIRETKITDAVIIVAGDCGFGFEKEQYYINEYNRIKTVLINQNVHIVFVRGNHDNKLFFTNEIINYPNFTAIPDYSILTITTENNDQKNILCIGGAISIDRLHRIENDRNKKNKTYWDDEKPVFSPEILDEIKNDKILIDVVVTHTSPNFAPLVDKIGIESWGKYDKELYNDIDEERLIITEIYNHLIKHNNPVKVWCYGHFHQNMISYSHENVKFVMLNCVNPRYNQWDIYPIYFHD